jgi:hypothetical protein
MSSYELLLVGESFQKGKLSHGLEGVSQQLAVDSTCTAVQLNSQVL